MCEVNWVLLTGFISAVASAANAALLVWMILVTKRYVNANLAILQVNRETLQELRKQYDALIIREIRPYRNLLDRAVRNLESLKKRGLVYEFESRDESKWVTEDELLPADYSTFLHQAMSFDSDLYMKLDLVRSKLILRPAEIISEMQRLGRSGRSTLPELPQLQAEFRNALDPIITLLKSTQESLAIPSVSNSRTDSRGL